ncbi:MAG: DNA-3-methyladenine glycosylase [Thermoanaerobaculaceae bacterium]|nr:DNA-3-methyladenine glycosylase [Thermoanaerobaculaceae bacterium]
MKPAPPETHTVRGAIEPLPFQAVERLAPLPRGFYQRDTVQVARELLGKLIVRRVPTGVVVARLVEVEAYLGVEDPACHTFRGRRTRRTETMWGEAGHLYVYFVYGMHHCANVVTRGVGVPEAVLLRGAVVGCGALPPLEAVPGGGDGCLLSGPARLTRALAIDLRHNGMDLTAGAELFLADDGCSLAPGWVQALPRVGVHYAGEAAGWPLRFVVAEERGQGAAARGGAGSPAAAGPSRPGPPAGAGRTPGGGRSRGG